jgi:hypothetical protein
MSVVGMPLAILGRHYEVVVFVKCTTKVLPDVEWVAVVNEGEGISKAFASMASSSWSLWHSLHMLICFRMLELR